MKITVNFSENSVHEKLNFFPVAHNSRLITASRYFAKIKLKDTSDLMLFLYTIKIHVVR